MKQNNIAKINNVTINKKYVQDNYPTLDRYYLDIINALQDGTSHKNIFYIEDLTGKVCVIKNKRIDRSDFDFGDKKSGVYIITNKNKLPMYIGCSYSDKPKISTDSEKHALKQRICQHLRLSDQAGFINKKVKVVESFLQGKAMLDDKLVEIVEGFEIVCIVTGDKKDKMANEKAYRLEKLLLSIFPTRYNN